MKQRRTEQSLEMGRWQQTQKGSSIEKSMRLQHPWGNRKTEEDIIHLSSVSGIPNAIWQALSWVYDSKYTDMVPCLMKLIVQWDKY